ncbi:hypothetical protein Lser_V15G03572 [Lactuca serriola]
MIRSHSDTREENPPASRYESFSLDQKNTLLVIVILIATASYQTALTPPGGVWQDNYHPSADPPASSVDYSVALRHHTSGTAIMSTNKYQGAYIVYVISNSLGFYVSVFMIFRLTYDFPLLLELHLLLLLFSINYTTCMISILPSSYKVVFYISIGIAVIYSIITLSMLLKQRKSLKYTFRLHCISCGDNGMKC